MLDRIRVNPEVCEGKPTIRGLRITVDFVLKLLGDGYTAHDITREYPELEAEDVYQAHVSEIRPRTPASGNAPG